MIGKIKIDTNGNTTTSGWKIFLDDADITKFVKGVRFSVSSGGLPRVSLDIIGQLVMPNDFQAIIETYSPESDKDVKAN